MSKIQLKAHFGLKADDGEGLLRALGVDFRSVYAPYVGQRLHEDIPERGVKVDNWGVHQLWVEHGSGGYWDYCDFPLTEANEETIANSICGPLPASAGQKRFSSIRWTTKAMRSISLTRPILTRP